jgi:hypothetical protein
MTSRNRCFFLRINVVMLSSKKVMIFKIHTQTAVFSIIFKYAI